MTPGPGDTDVTRAEQQLRGLVALAAVVWVLVWVVNALSALDRVALPATYVVAVLVWVAGSLLALRALPVRRLPARAERRDAWLVAATVPVAGLLELFATEADALGSPANWISSGSLVPLVALVLRGHERLAAGTVVTLLAAQAATLGPVTTDVPPATLVARAALAPMWVAGALVVRGYLRRTRDRAFALRARRASDATERLVAERWSELRARRFADLEGEVLPLLRRVSALAPDEPVPAADGALAASLADGLRDSLLARTLMTADLRRRVAAARGRGVRVALHNALEDGPDVAALRDLVGRLLEVPGAESLSVRTFEEPREATLVLRLADSALGTAARAVSAEVGAGVDGWATATVHDLDGVLVVELAEPAGGTVG